LGGGWKKDGERGRNEREITPEREHEREKDVAR